MIGRCRRAILASDAVGHRMLGRIGPHRRVAQRRATVVGKVAEGHELQAVAGRTDLGIDLKAPLQLRLVEAAEGPLEGKAEVGDVLLLGGPSGASEAQQGGSKAGGRKHLRHGHSPAPLHSPATTGWPVPLAVSA